MMIVIPSFAVSTLVSFVIEALLQYRTITFSLRSVEPKDTLSVGRLHGALIARWRLTRCGLLMTFLWMSDFLSLINDIVMGCFTYYQHTYLQLHFRAISPSSPAVQDPKSIVDGS